jgi:hypothetical protein
MRSERGQATVDWIGIVLLVALALTALARLAPSADGGELGTTLLRSVTCAARDRCENEGGSRAARPQIAPGTGGRPAGPDRGGRPAGPDTGGRPAAPDTGGRPVAPDTGGDSFDPLSAFRRLVTIPPLVPHPGHAAPTGGRSLPGGRQAPVRGGRAGMPALPRSVERTGRSAILRWARRTGGRALESELRRMLRGRVLRGAGTAWRRAWFACLVYERFRWAFLHPESRFPGYSFPPEEVLRIANDCISPVDLVRDWPLLTDG